MKRAYVKAYNKLKKMGVPVFVHIDSDIRDGGFSISAEEENSERWVNYYAGCGSFNFWNGYAVNPKLTKVLDDYRLYAEWANPGSLSVYQK